MQSVPPSRPSRPILGNDGIGRNENARMGDFSLAKLPSSILMATGGVAGFMLSGALPSPFDLLIKAAGIGLVGYGIYDLVSAPSTPVSPSKPVTEGGALVSKGNIGAVTGDILVPQPNAKHAAGGFLTYSYDVKFRLINADQEPVTVPLELRVAYYKKSGTVFGNYFWNVEVPGSLSGGQAIISETVSPKGVDPIGPAAAGLYIGDRLLAGVKFTIT